MTSEHRLRFEIADIAEVVIECVSCASSVSVPLAAINATLGLPRVPPTCPRCGARWEGERQQSSPEATFLADLALYVQRLAEPHHDPAVRIRLDLQAPRPISETSS